MRVTQFVSRNGCGKFEILLDNVRALRSDLLRKEQARRALAGFGLADAAARSGKSRDHSRSDRPLQIDGGIVVAGFQIVAKCRKLASRAACEQFATPLPGGRKVETIDDGLPLGCSSGVAARAALGHQQRPPARLNDPVDDPLRVRMAQRGNRGQGMQNVSHGAQPHHEQTKLGLRVQVLIFSRRRGSVHSGNEPVDGRSLIFDFGDETCGCQRKLRRKQRGKSAQANLILFRCDER